MEVLRLLSELKSLSAKLTESRRHTESRLDDMEPRRDEGLKMESLVKPNHDFGEGLREARESGTEE